MFQKENKRNIQDNIKRYDIIIMAILKEKKRENGEKEILEALGQTSIEINDSH